MSRSLDFTSCTKSKQCQREDCYRKLTKEEEKYIEDNYMRHSVSNFDDGCFKEEKDD